MFHSGRAGRGRTACRGHLLTVGLLVALALPGAGALAAEVEFLGVRAPVPDAWQQEAPQSSMRLLQFAVPGADGSRQAEVVVYFFGVGQGGTPAANIARWESQFRGPGGGPVSARVDEFAVAGMAVTRARLQGSYARGVGMGPQGAAREGQALTAALVQTPRGQVILQLHGDAAVVAAADVAFDRLLRGMVPAAGG